jgi:hypothetical protein
MLEKSWSGNGIFAGTQLGSSAYLQINRTKINAPNINGSLHQQKFVEV